MFQLPVVLACGENGAWRFCGRLKMVSDAINETKVELTTNDHRADMLRCFCLVDLYDVQVAFSVISETRMIHNIVICKCMCISAEHVIVHARIATQLQSEALH
ncbi:hypothetical protein V6N13_073127 [Hibiscus sabdariffa]|uniref:Uncharacterized protein n=1 Tax=Hibiscus sabdariffa TaxID=183260 RepID=A0ABR2E8L5_9ROSI